MAVNSNARLSTGGITTGLGWYRAQGGEKFCERTPASGWCDNPRPTVEGKHYLAFGGRLTHVTLLPCGEAHVLAAIAEHTPNVFCEESADRVAQFNADESRLTPIRVFSDHDMLMRGIVPKWGSQ